jgi:hypothetical protein
MHGGSTELQVRCCVFVLVATSFMRLCKELDRSFVASTLYQERWKFILWSSTCISYPRCFGQGSLTSFSGLPWKKLSLKCIKQSLHNCYVCVLWSSKLRNRIDLQFAISQIFRSCTTIMGIFFFPTDFIPTQVAFHIWVHLDMGAKHDFSGLTPEKWLLGAVGAVRVAVRGLSASGSLLRPPSQYQF